MYTTRMPVTHASQMKLSYTLDLGLWMLVNHHIKLLTPLSQNAMQQQQLSYYLSKYPGPPLHETGPHIKPGGHILG